MLPYKNKCIRKTFCCSCEKKIIEFHAISCDFMTLPFTNIIIVFFSKIKYSIKSHLAKTFACILVGQNIRNIFNYISLSSGNSFQQANEILEHITYSKTCVKQLLSKRPKIGF